MKDDLQRKMTFDGRQALLEYNLQWKTTLGKQVITYHMNVVDHNNFIKYTSQAAKGALSHCLQCRTACKIQNGH